MNCFFFRETSEIVNKIEKILISSHKYDSIISVSHSFQKKKIKLPVSIPIFLKAVDEILNG